MTLVIFLEIYRTYGYVHTAILCALSTLLEAFVLYLFNCFIRFHYRYDITIFYNSVKALDWGYAL